MKHFLITIIVCCTSLYGQTQNSNTKFDTLFNHMHRIGTDDSLLLNAYESAFLNIIFKPDSRRFDFSGKKVGFLKISGQSGKMWYFKMQKKHLVDNEQPCDNGKLYVFNASQKKESGGYDAAIVYWSKFLMPVEKVIKRLK